MNCEQTPIEYPDIYTQRFATWFFRNSAPIQFPQGVAMYKDVGAAAYLECSSLTGYGVTSVFEKAMRLGGTQKNINLGIQITGVDIEKTIS